MLKMKRLFLIIVLIMTCMGVYSQDISGQWNGALKVQGMQLRLVFHISKSDNGYSATMDSPDQGAKGIPVTTTTFVAPKLVLSVTALRIEYTGELTEGKIKGVFRQNGMEFPMDLSREAVIKEVVKRPQEPVKPYPYVVEEVTFRNEKEQFDLAGTLTLPSSLGKFPAVILITGSGPQNRDEELMGHKPFLVLADYLTRQGIAVLRYDDRGVGQSKGSYKSATSEDFATDAESAYAFLKTRKEILPGKIGFAGHSEGGIIAPMVAARNKGIGFIVLLAGTGVRGDQLLLLQQGLIAKASGMTDQQIGKIREVNSRLFEMVVKSEQPDTLKAELSRFLLGISKSNPEYASTNEIKIREMIEGQVGQVANPWMRYFIKYDPTAALEKVKCPVLAVNGDKDLQVPSKVNLPAIEKALKLGGNKRVVVKEYGGLNHLFQECGSGLPAEYPTIEQTFSPRVMADIAQWILELNK